MTYELTKKLKDAGFPFDWQAGITIDTFPEQPSFEKYPPLSELIEACGDRFALHKRPENKGWRAWIINKERTAYKSDFQTDGSTTEEAVAKLWLELNKKK